jgi:hypothetical protein
MSLMICARAAGWLIMHMWAASRSMTSQSPTFLANRAWRSGGTTRSCIVRTQVSGEHRTLDEWRQQIPAGAGESVAVHEDDGGRRAHAAISNAHAP